VSLAIISDPYH